MNAIIWWLESPWQLRTLVFIFSFFVCFIAPWLYSQSLVSTRISRKPLEEKSETVSVPKTEGPAQQAEDHAKVPASQEQAPAQVAALPAETAAPAKREQLQVPAQPTVGIVPAPAAEEKAPAPAEIAAGPAEEEAPVRSEEAPSSGQSPAEPAPAPVTQEQQPPGIAAVPAEEEAPAPSQEAPVAEQAPVKASPPPVAQEQAPATARIATPPAEAKSPIEREEGPALPKAPVYAAPAPAPQERPAPPAQVAAVPAEPQAPILQEQGPAPVQKPIEMPPAPAEPKTPAKQQQATVQAPVPPAAKPESAGRFSFVDLSGSGIPVPSGGSVERQEFAASTGAGGAANLEVYVLSTRALRRPNRPGGLSNGDVNAVLDSDAFASAAARFDTVACVGLGSRKAALSKKEVARLADNGAVQLCGIIARKPYVSENTRLYGLPLEQLNSAPSARDRHKALVIIGIKDAKGELADAAVQKRMIAEIIRGGKIANFPLGAESEAASGQELHYIEVKAANGFKNRPLNVAPVKRGYAIQQKEQGLQKGPAPRASAGHRHCAASAALSRGTKKPGNSGAHPAAAKSKAHGCGIFDFPF